MSKMLKVLLCLSLAAASTAATAAKKNPNVEQEVKAQLLHKAFTTKILVASYIPCKFYLKQNSSAFKLVDTELSSDGSIKYYSRANCMAPNAFILLDPARGYVSQGFSSEIAPGTSVWVRSVDFKEDRVEIRLSTNNDDKAEGSGKIKYMLGSSYRALSTDELMAAIAHGLRIPAYDRLIELKSEFDALGANLQEAESKYNTPGGTPTLKLANAVALKQVLEKLQGNRAEIQALGKSDPQAGVYSEKLSALTPEITRLTEESRKEQIAIVREKLQAQLSQLSAIQEQVRQKAPASITEWQKRSDSLSSYKFFLGERQKLLDVLQNENEPPSPSDVKYLNDSRAEVDTLQKDLERDHQQLKLADLTSQYSQLTKKRAQMLDAYSRAFETAKERPALQGLKTVLDQMVSNREQAAELGDKSAASQLVKCRAEAEKYKRK